MSSGLFTYLAGINLVQVFSSLLHGAGIFKIAPYSYFLYSDIPNFFTKASAPGWPYVNSQIEYPVIIGLFIRAMGLLGGTLRGYYIASSVFLLLLAVFSTFLLYKIVRPEDRKKLWHYWILSPSMLIFGIYNWDMLAIVCVVTAIYLVWKKQDLWAVVFLTIGAWSKLYPVLYLLPLLLKQNKWRDRINIILVAGAVTLAVNLPFAMANFDFWSYFFTFNSARISTFDSIWTVFRSIFPGFQDEKIINFLSLSIFSIWYFWMVWKYKNESVLKSWYLATLIFLATNKIFSPQYLLWLLPFYVVLSAPDYRKFFALEISNLVILSLTLTWFFVDKNLSYFYMAEPFILLKYAMLIALYFEMARRKLLHRVLPYEAMGDIVKKKNKTTPVILNPPASRQAE